jgi:ERCC4-type nuclease
MGISLDYRTGSVELAPLFRPYGIQVETKKLDFGDLAFEGRGPRGRTAIVLERKRIEDLIQSIESKRLSGHQLPGMADAYDYCYVIVEGLWRPGAEGELLIGHGGWERESSTFGGRWTGSHGRLQYRAVDNYLATLELHAGVIYRRTLGPLETVAVVVDLYRWWTEKDWDAHSSHLAVYAPAVAKAGKGRFSLARRYVSYAEKMAMQLPELDAKARTVAEHFGSAKAMANATEAEWLEIKGVGKVTAKKAVEAINAQV